MTKRRSTRRGSAVRIAAAVALAALLSGSSPALAQRSITWRSESTPYPGVRLRLGRANFSSAAGSELYAAYVDLCTDGVAMAVTAPRTALERTSSWASSGGISLAVNGDFYENIGGSWFLYGDAVGNALRWPATNSGVGIGDWHWAHRAWGWIAFGPGWVEITHTRYVKENRDAFRAAGYAVDDGWMPATVAPDPPPDTYNLISGFPELVIDGRVYTCPDPTGACFPDRGDMSVRHPRTAIGLTRTRDTAILVVVDGRGRRDSVGADGQELAWLMGELGAWNALNLDGGGSSTMWLRGTGIVNAPSDGTERAVFNHVGVFTGGEGSGVNCPCRAEGCNGRDDDCDGAVDEDVCAIDAGAPDAGAQDAGLAADAGSEDAGATAEDLDGGGERTDARMDAGSAPGTDGLHAGCGCRAVGAGGSGGAWIAALLAWLALLGSRRRRHALASVR